MAKPVILSVDDDPQVLTALGTLGNLKPRADPVALFFVDQRMTGVEFLEEALGRFFDAKRVLLRWTVGR